MYKLHRPRQAGQAGQAEENIWQAQAGWKGPQPVVGRPGQ